MTNKIRLRTGFANHPHVRVIKDSSAASPLVRFDFEEVPVISRAFRRLVRTLDFDLCEIALTTLALAMPLASRSRRCRSWSCVGFTALG